jgi:copper(I)-binding protein
MKTIVSAIGFAAALVVSGPALAQVEVKDAWVRGTVAQQQATGAFMQLSAAEDLRLVQVQSPVAGVVEIHEMKMDGGVMRMRPITALELPANRTVELKPGGYHVMLMDLKKPLAEGETVPLTLIVESRGGKRSTVEVKAAVRPLGAPGGMQMHGK